MLLATAHAMQSAGQRRCTASSVSPDDETAPGFGVVMVNQAVMFRPLYSFPEAWVFIA